MDNEHVLDLPTVSFYQGEHLDVAFIFIDFIFLN